MGRHVSLSHFYPWMSQRFGIGEQDRFSMCSGIAHDPLQRDIFTPLFFGASIHIPTQDGMYFSTHTLFYHTASCAVKVNTVALQYMHTLAFAFLTAPCWRLTANIVL